jgi:hypothetical protein
MILTKLALAKSIFSEKCDSPRQICASNERVLQELCEWPLLSKSQLSVFWLLNKERMAYFQFLPFSWPKRGFFKDNMTKSKQIL